jgi:hypothetical protein
VIPFPPVRVNAAGFFEIEVPATGKVAFRVVLSRDLRGSSVPIGRRGWMPHGLIEAQKLRLDLCYVTFASVFEAACASTAFADECFNEHDCGPLEHPKPPNKRLRRLPHSIESYLSIGDNRRRYAGSGVENPSLDTPHRDCSRQGLRPNPDRSGHLVSRKPPFALSKKTRVRERHR